jgi:hypothetical protein
MNIVTLGLGSSAGAGVELSALSDCADVDEDGFSLVPLELHPHNTLTINMAVKPIHNHLLLAFSMFRKTSNYIIFI